MVQIAGKPFTQLLNLNMLDEFRVQGQLVGGFVITEISGNYIVTLDDAAVIAVAGPAKTITLPLASTAARSVAIKNRTASAIATILPVGPNLIDGAASVALNLNQSVVLVPFSGGWVRL